MPARCSDRLLRGNATNTYAQGDSKRASGKGGENRLGNETSLVASFRALPLLRVKQERGFLACVSARGACAALGADRDG